MTDFWARAKRINNIEPVNSDPLLSEFKHHFTIQRVHLPRNVNLEAFAERVPGGFGLANSFSNSLYIAQFVNLYENDLVDIAVAFRRDETAIQIATGNLEFKYENQMNKVELSPGFRIFMEDLRNQEIEMKKKDEFQQPKVSNELAEQQNMIQSPKENKVEGLCKIDLMNREKKRSRSRSKSRSRSRQKKKQIFNRLSSSNEPFLLQRSHSDRVDNRK